MLFFRHTTITCLVLTGDLTMANLNQTPTFNLGVVLQETGLNADTLRAWERRYGLPQPARSAGGHRLYSQHDIDTVKWLISRQDEGMSISKAVKLWRNLDAEGRNPFDELPSRLDVLQKPPALEIPVGAQVQDLREQWVSACLQFDEATAERISSYAFALFSPEVVCFDIFFAGLAQIGESWYQRQATVQQEHFASALVTRRINTLITAAPASIHNKLIVVGCPPNEDHELPALMITYLLRTRGWPVVYLGANVPLVNFEETLDSVKPDLMILVAQTLQTASTLKEIALALSARDLALAFGGLIFNRLPDLSRCIPGAFLGNDLRNVVPVVEQVLKLSPALKSNPEQHAIDIETLNYFTEIRPLLEEKMRAEVGSFMPFEYLQLANQHMAEDITAAIKLGNMKYLGGEMDWLDGLLSNFNVSGDLLSGYIGSYKKAVDQVFDERGEEIINWIAKQTRQFE